MTTNSTPGPLTAAIAARRAARYEPAVVADSAETIALAEARNLPVRIVREWVGNR